MFADVDLRALAEMTSPERAFLSVYLAKPSSAADLEKRFRKVRRVLSGRGEDRPSSPAEKDEREHFDENCALVMKYLEKNPFESGSVAIFSCWALDYLLAVPLAAKVPDLVQVDSSPFVRPLAEVRDEYENVAVVVADNTRARVFLISSAVAGDEDVVKGNVKNHVKKGGWSQQRYERRRDKQLLLYAREIVAALEDLHREEDFRRILLVGGKEALRAIRAELPAALERLAADKALDLRRGEGAVNEDIWELFRNEERESERDLWERIRAEYMKGGLGAAGLDDVLAAAREGRIDRMIVERAFKPAGRRCRECERLEAGAPAKCGGCGSESLFEVDLVNEIVEILEQTGATVDFADPIPSLTEAGGIAALLRYRV
ncbi:MAG: baeRF10 domain-containing protein [Planctomycetota bacterium]|jgi:peptide chain release factor subunit 1